MVVILGIGVLVHLTTPEEELGTRGGCDHGLDVNGARQLRHACCEEVRKPWWRRPPEAGPCSSDERLRDGMEVEDEELETALEHDDATAGQGREVLEETQAHVGGVGQQQLWWPARSRDLQRHARSPAG